MAPGRLIAARGRYCLFLAASEIKLARRLNIFLRLSGRDPPAKKNGVVIASLPLDPALGCGRRRAATAGVGDGLSEDPSLASSFFLGVTGWGDGYIQVCVVVDGPP